MFLISDDQLKEENSLEIISGIPNTGVVPYLFKNDEYEELRQAVQPETQALCKASLGESLRNRLRQFPSPINDTTAAVFDEWWLHALLSVAKQYFREVAGIASNEVDRLKTVAARMTPETGTRIEPMSLDLVDDIAQLLVKIGLFIQQKAQQLLAEQRRVYHITPTSFFNFLHAFCDVIREWQRIVLATKKR
jgi:dynein heavy chain